MTARRWPRKSTSSRRATSPPQKQPDPKVGSLRHEGLPRAIQRADLLGPGPLRAAVGKWQFPICRLAPAEHSGPTRADGARTDASTLHANDQIINIA